MHLWCHFYEKHQALHTYSLTITRKYFFVVFQQFLNQLPFFIPRLDTTYIRYFVLWSRNSFHKFSFCFHPNFFFVYDDKIKPKCQVPVPHGEPLVEGKVADICENSGMKAVCWGDEKCSWTTAANSRWWKWFHPHSVDQVRGHTIQLGVWYHGQQEHFDQGANSCNVFNEKKYWVNK